MESGLSRSRYLGVGEIGTSGIRTSRDLVRVPVHECRVQDPPQTLLVWVPIQLTVDRGEFRLSVNVGETRCLGTVRVSSESMSRERKDSRTHG